MDKFVDVVNTFLWDNFLIYALLGIGIYYTIRLKVPQLSKIVPGFKQTFGSIFKKDKDSDVSGMTSFQALSTAVAAQVGTGNLAGVATAISSGGPGAIFWMWVSAVLGMATNFGEAVLAQKYSTEIDGERTGGPAYYISKGVKSKFLATFFAVTIIIALGFVGSMVQSNSISTAVYSAFGVNKIVVGIITSIIVALILVGGMKRIANFAELVVPIMAGFYILGSIVILFKFHDQVLIALKSIFVGAFSPRAAVGGALGITVKNAVRFGIARGLFSNEAGMGSTPHAHAVAKVAHPAQQGMVAMVGVIIDTVIICTVTALINLVTQANTLGLTGIEMTQKAFELGLGSFGLTFIAIGLFFFALTTIIGWYFFGEANIKFLFGIKGIKAYRVLVLVFIVLGSFLDVDFVWKLADMFNGLMVIPNLIALLILAPQASAIIKDYDNNFLKR
ncbi:sodium:alanine symporter family protein [Gottschalkia acidurici 9a]|uniref:Sodium:alanine symporter family protein n=1 Tax=Gottschalkia acidurici (strain ATCC 7906 / DSM 604 / BCRC 14475 / CIP 104303 / KCTC 5404 / NCIMB 10678 / 9a) TaxID=1128398 RepID=K0AXI7_GOTA9|nr:sodium:alanine symporter family protein [Gottschalkia acidurici]AFS77487.1 sodium:alanine symporter family protein [Gottschalkia acidurici 9a]